MDTIGQESTINEKEKQYSDDHEAEEDNDNDEIKDDDLFDQETNQIDDQPIKKEIDVSDVQNKALLMTLNAIGKDKFWFADISDTILNDSLPRFVMYFLKIKSIENVKLNNSKNATKTQKLTNQEIQNINAVIEYLKTKELKFHILKFDFKDLKTRESSAILFYSNFLNLFFVKYSIDEIYDRLGIIFCNRSDFNDYENYIELTKYDTYINLFRETILKYLLTNEIIDKSKLLANKVCEYLFHFVNVPAIINNDILSIGTGNNMADAVYYQIQFIFDAIDSSPKNLKILEIFLKTIYILKRIRLPRLDLLAKSIWAKRTSIELQNQITKQYLNKKSSQSFSSNENIQSKDDKKQLNFPKTYKERYEATNKSQTPNEELNINIDDKKPEKEKSTFDFSYLKSRNIDVGFDSGVIIYNKSKYEQNKEKNQSVWNKEIEIIKKYDKKKHRKSLLSSNQKKIKEKLSFSSPQNSFMSKLYKIFYYDEQNEKWCFDSDVFDQFSNDKRINISNSKTPIVLFINSYEKDSIDIVSNLINGIYPLLDSEEQIFVYSFCDKNLSLLNFTVDFLDKDKGSVKPIFLLLHVPKSKEKLSNIHQIVFKIYSFLSLLTDLEVIVLNKENYVDQIEFMKVIKDISKSITFYRNIKSVKKVERPKNFTSESKEKEKVKNDIENDDNDEFETWDSDSDSDSDNNKNIINDNDDGLYNQADNDEIFAKIETKYYKTIMLVNDSIDQFNDEIELNLRKSQFFISLESQIQDAKIHFINSNINESYEAFLKGFNDALMIAKSTFHNLKSNFQCIKLSEMNDIYIDFRIRPSTWKEKLKKIVKTRYNELESSQTRKGSSFVLLSKLRNEISSIFPSFDEDFNNEYKLILSDLKQDSNKKNQEIFSSELEKSANLRLSYIEQKIKKKHYFSEESIDNVLKSHIQFLKDDFFNIIQLNSTEKVYNMIYEDNIEILQNQIQTDTKKIKSIFKIYLDMIHTKRLHVEKDIMEGVKKGTNYCMKESENLKEIKVTVEVNSDLESVIEQDF